MPKKGFYELPAPVSASVQNVQSVHNNNNRKNDISDFAHFPARYSDVSTEDNRGLLDFTDEAVVDNVNEFTEEAYVSPATHPYQGKNIIHDLFFYHYTVKKFMNFSRGRVKF